MLSTRSITTDSRRIYLDAAVIWVSLTFLLLILKFAHRVSTEGLFDWLNLFNWGVVFNSFVWVIFLPLVVWVARKINIFEYPWNWKNLLFHIGISIWVTAIQSIAFTVIHSIIWPSTLSLSVQLDSSLIIADVRYNILIYWIILFGFYALNNFSSPTGDRFNSKILAVLGNRKILLQTEKIEYLRSSGNYVSLFSEKKEYLIRQSISEMENRLDPAVFIRVHRCRIINKSEMREIRKGSHGEYIFKMSDGSEICASKSYSSEIERFLSQYK